MYFKIITTLVKLAPPKFKIIPIPSAFEFLRNENTHV
jgi:hypothetical protein